MKSSDSDSDLQDYFSKLKKQASHDFDDGLSDLTVSESSHNAKKKTTKISKNKSKDKISKVKKSKNKKQKIDNAEKSKPVSKSYDFSQKTSSKIKSKSFVPKLDFRDLDEELGIKLDKISKSDDDTSSFGKDGKRFLKKKPKEEEKPATPKEQLIESLDLSSVRDVSSSTRKSTLRSIHSPQSRKKVTIIDDKEDEKLSGDKSFDGSISENYDGSENENKFMGLNILSINDIESDLDEGKEESIKDISKNSVDYSESSNKKEPKIRSISLIGLSKQENVVSIEEIQDDDYDDDENNNRHDDRKIIKDEIKINNIPSRSITIKSIESEESIEEISEVGTLLDNIPMTGRQKSARTDSIISVPLTERNGKLSARTSLNKEYTMTFDSDIVTNPSEATEVETELSQKQLKKQKSKSKPKKEKSQKIKQPTETLHKKIGKPQIHYHWDAQLDGEPYIPPRVGMKGVDPSPIAQYVVSPEALESVTAYSPYMLLLTNTLRMQIDMTKNIIDSQKRLYNAFLGTLEPKYEYCTLEGTKKFIKSHKSKRNIENTIE